jgi:hypothetical protein
VPLVIIRHALVRLTQRANVRTIADLLAAAGELWQPVDRQLNASGEALEPPRGWRIPLMTGHPASLAFAVVGRIGGGTRREFLTCLRVSRHSRCPRLTQF